MKILLHCPSVDRRGTRSTSESEEGTGQENADKARNCKIERDIVQVDILWRSINITFSEVLKVDVSSIRGKCQNIDRRSIVEVTVPS
jgi:hypothetical protein